MKVDQVMPCMCHHAAIALVIIKMIMILCNAVASKHEHMLIKFE